MPTNWPPANAPAFPPISAESVDALIDTLRANGWSDRAPTNQERTLYAFDSVRCDLGHPAVFRMAVDPGGQAYPAGACNQNHDAAAGEKSRALFLPYDPWYVNTYTRG